MATLEGNALTPELLASIFETTREGLVVTDAQLEPPGPRIVAVNPAFSRISGYPPEEVMGRTPRLLQGPRTDPKVLGTLRKTLRAGKIFRGETYNYRKNGEEFLMSWYIQGMKSSEGEVTHYLGVQRDVTFERKMESIARSKTFANSLGFLVAGLRHELGNPVNSVKTAIGLVTKFSEQLAPEAIHEHLGGALQEISRIEYLLKTLKTFSFKEQVEVVELRLDRFLERFLRFVRLSFKEEGIRLEIEGIEPGLTVSADPRALHQVLINLVANAIDAVRSREDPYVRISAAARRGWAEIVIDDNGVGISKSELEGLFAPFHSSKPGGTGLGLMLSRQLVSEMGGELGVEPAESGE